MGAGHLPAHGAAGCSVLLAAAILVPSPRAGAWTRDAVRLGDGSTLNVLVEGPATNAAESRLAVVLAGGNADTNLAASVMNALGVPLAHRGWTAVAPISPDGQVFLGRNAARVLLLVDAAPRHFGVKRGRALLAGQSNGGIAALYIAASRPSSFVGALAAPGILLTGHRIGQYRKLPVYLRVGARDDLRWGEAYPAVVKRLQAAGARLDARLLPDAGHGIPLDWTEIDRWLGSAARNASPPTL